MALVSKTSGSNPLQVQVLHPPQSTFFIEGPRGFDKNKKAFYDGFFVSFLKSSRAFRTSVNSLFSLSLAVGDSMP